MNTFFFSFEHDVWIILFLNMSICDLFLVLSRAPMMSALNTALVFGPITPLVPNYTFCDLKRRRWYFLSAPQYDIAFFSSGDEINRRFLLCFLSFLLWVLWENIVLHAFSHRFNMLSSASESPLVKNGGQRWFFSVLGLQLGWILDLVYWVFNCLFFCQPVCDSCYGLFAVFKLMWKKFRYYR